MGSEICSFYKYGFCKFLEKCNKMHIKESCVEKNCVPSLCRYHHPKKCRYYEKFGNCKFGENCCYLHKKSDTNERIVCLENKIKTLEEELFLLKFQISRQQNLLCDLPPPPSDSLSGNCPTPSIYTTVATPNTSTTSPSPVPTTTPVSTPTSPWFNGWSTPRAPSTRGLKKRPPLSSHHSPIGLESPHYLLHLKKWLGPRSKK